MRVKLLESLSLIGKLMEASLTSTGWSAAVRVNRGPCALADDHQSAWLEWFESVGLDHEEAIGLIMSRDLPDGWEEGFVSPEGMFMSRDEALARWRKDYKYSVPKGDGDRDWGDSEDLKWNPSELALSESRVVSPERKRGNIIILMGSPGSGKSMVTKFGLIDLDNLVALSSDIWTELSARKSGEDTSNPEVTYKHHELVSDKYKTRTSKSILSGRKDANYMIEVTGKSLSSLVGKIESLRESGLRIILVHVQVPIRVAVAGNMSRKRQVPNDMLVAAHDNATKNFEFALSLADEGWVINNWVGDRYPSFGDFRSSDLIQRVK
jgi:predicted ABC-type ATPase